MQYYDSSGHKKQNSYVPSPVRNASMNGSLTNMSIPVDFQRSRILNYQEKLGLIDKAVTQIKFPILSSHKQEY